MGEPTKGMMKVWVTFLEKLCSDGNKLRKCLGKWKNKNETRNYEWMLNDKNVYHTVEGCTKEHVITRRERRKLTYAPTGREVDLIPINAVPTEEIEEGKVTNIEIWEIETEMKWKTEQCLTK